LFATNQSIGDLSDSLKNGGVIDPTTGQSLAVVYDSAAKDTVTLGGAGATTPVQVKNVAAGTDDTDAVNVAQLKDAGLVAPIDPTNPGSGLASLAVTYDKNADGSANFDQIALKGGANGTKITNVAAGDLSATSTDAVNGSQLYATNTRVGSLEDSLNNSGLIDPVTGQSLAVVYDSAAKDRVTLGNAGTPVVLSNVAAGVVDTDAVNVGQLKDTGLVGEDGQGNLTSLAVTYDDATKAGITLGNAGTPVAIHNVAAGDLSATSTDAVNGSQLFATNQSIGDLSDSLKNGGVIDPTTGQSLAVVYDSAAKDTVTLGGAGATTPVQLKNVAAGTDDTDAVNVAQLKDTGLVGEDGQGNLTSLAVTYDDATKAGITLGNAGTPVAIHNVAEGNLSATSTDAVNGSQLYATNTRVGSLEDSLNNSGLIDPVTGQSLAVTYDSAAKDTVTLGGAGATTPVQVKNVAAGTDDTDAVNVAQLKDAGLVAPIDPTNPGSGLASLAVTYDKNADGSANFDQIALKGGANGTKITNVAAGAVSATSTDAINGSQLHGTAQSVADSLGGGSTVGADGTVTSPTYSLADPADASQKQDYHNVGDALANLDGRVVDNTTNITVIKNQLADSGLVDPVTGQSIAAVTYDRNADGTPNYGSVTLGNGNGPVRVSNVADGVARNDAVNLGQLQDAGLVAPVDPTNPGTGLASLAVTYDKHADGSANFDRITLAGANGTTITNVKAGAVNATSTDAVNGAQLHGVAQSVADSLGGGSTVDPDGKVTSPTYVVNNQTFNNVGDAITNISNSLADGSIGLVQQDETSRDITVAKDTDGTVVDFAGTAGDRVLTGVAAGAVNATSKDAINGSQLYGTAQSVADVIGGGTTVDPDGTLANTAIEVNGNKYKTVAEAVQAAAAYGATDSLAVRYDLNADGTPNYGSVTLGGTGAAPVVLTNVADGVNKYDAVNYGQLSDLRDQFSGLDDRVGALEQNPGNGGGGGGGGGSGDNPYFAGTGDASSAAANAGTGTGNTAAGSGSTIGSGANNGTVIGSGSNVSKDNGTAIGSGASSTGEGATAIGSGANASGNQSVAIGQGSVANEANTVSFGNGTDDGNRRIVNIADGINANDATTKGQLDRAVGGLQGQINDVSRNAYSGIAAATALTMIPGVDPGKTLSFGVGGATYKGYQAVAFGGEARITQNLKMKAGVGLSSGGNTVGVGASYQW
ncbi:YadA family autotransporter adhesin, partial [Burkholderia sp. MSMB2157WGS]|uniref:YadA family autotransporter adhesin n=1 Tax=Burkholderia sp. MSMB2157WGS TaxID=1637928 RepID=UPI000AD0E701